MKNYYRQPEQPQNGLSKVILLCCGVIVVGVLLIVWVNGTHSRVSVTQTEQVPIPIEIIPVEQASVENLQVVEEVVVQSANTNSGPQVERIEFRMKPRLSTAAAAVSPEQQ